MDNKKITITIPTLSLSGASKDLQNSYMNLKQKIHNFAILFTETQATIIDRSRKKVSNFMNTVNNGFKRSRKKLLMSIFPILLILLLVGTGFYILRTTTKGEVQGSNQNNPIAIADAKKTKSINKTFTFPLLDAKGEEQGSFNYIIESAEIRDEIVVQGKKASAVKGRTFLIVNLKLTNDLEQGLQITSRDYIRLSVNGNTKELLAPDIHNDPVEVQAISVKPTRVGFAINDTDKGHTLIVGEINGEKEQIRLQF